MNRAFAPQDFTVAQRGFSPKHPGQPISPMGQRATLEIQCSFTVGLVCLVIMRAKV
jgi:hypothetical protein